MSSPSPAVPAGSVVIIRQAIAGCLLCFFLSCFVLLCFIPLLARAGTDFYSSGDSELLPPGFPQPKVPADNPLTASKARLGELLFSDVRLSINSSRSCASCHIPSRFFTDGLPQSRGALGELLPFNTPTLLNAAYSTSFSWIESGVDSLEEQHKGPLTNDRPVEMGMGQAQLDALTNDAALLAALRRAFPEAAGFDEEHVTKALASYVRTLIRGGSAFDRFLFADEPGGLTEQAQAGLLLFKSSRLNCVSCHRGFLLSGPTQSARAQFKASFYRTGVSGSETAFRVPSLRFVKHTAPYMHDGSQQTLDQVVQFYAAGGAAPEGSKAFEKLAPFKLTTEEHEQLLAFLRSL